jgi:hypothetical protein
MLKWIASFIQEYAVWLGCLAASAAALVIACYLRLRRLRARSRLAEQVEDTLVQNAQGLILSVHGIVTELDPNDRTRTRTERTLDRADEELSGLRDRIEDLRAPK